MILRHKTGESFMKKRTKSYSREFKLEAVRLSQGSDRPVAEVADELGISKSSLFRWRHELADDPEQVFPGRGQMKERDAEIARLRKELREARKVCMAVHVSMQCYVGKASVAVVSGWPD
jgi:transposase